ncbi:Malonyl-coa decarboxylase [Thalictrum thalictroides]|uniref:Malonyl-coa decarboxylase n=1 Tax=Thalictrum thalictroides TaxID=46969 RepID=A0A7J6V796_THATH|nr:Malonyl-coa decarboxylase [Thalictrum thalictroides]
MKNRKGWAILMRSRMKLPSNNTTNDNLFNKLPISNEIGLTKPASEGNQMNQNPSSFMQNSERELKAVQVSMHSAVSTSKTDIIDSVLNDFSEGYFSLSFEMRQELLLVLARECDVNRTQVRELIQQYLGLHPPLGEIGQESGVEESLLTAFYRTERNLRHALQPKYEILFERLNTHPGGLKFLSILRADLLSMLAKENIASVRALDSYLKEKLATWLSPASLELHHITWDDSASLLEKIVAYEAVHPISNILDLKRRLGVGRRCFGYFHPAIPGEPLIFIEVALQKNVAQTIKEVLRDDPPTPESEATCALFYSISSTQPGLAGINLGKFLIKRVIELVKRDMPHVSTFATLSPIPGYMQWLLIKLASQTKLAESEAGYTPHRLDGGSGSTFRKNILHKEEEAALMELSGEFYSGKNGMEVMWNLLNSKNYEWTSFERLSSVVRAPLMRLCSRYLLQEKKRGKALDAVANFHLQNGAMVERLNWMADQSEKGLCQSGGIMVNYVYRMDKIEENAQSYFGEGHIQASSDLQSYIESKLQGERVTGEK